MIKTLEDLDKKNVKITWRTLDGRINSLFFKSKEEAQKQFDHLKYFCKRPFIIMEIKTNGK